MVLAGCLKDGCYWRFARAATFDLNGGNKVYNVFGSFSKREQRIIDILFLCL